MTGPDRSAGRAILLDGDRLRDEVIAEIRATIAAERRLGDVVLAIVIAGDDPSSRAYVASKQAHARAAGISSRVVEAGGSEPAALPRLIEDLGHDPAVHGILVQLPLPDDVAAPPVLDAIPSAKDVDGLSGASLRLMWSGQTGFAPCSALAVIRFIERYEIPTVRRTAVVVGATFADALPLLALLSQAPWQLTVTLVHPANADLAAVCRQADFLVSVAHQPGLITHDHVKPGAAVFDLGINGTAAGVPGDICFNEVADVAGWLTPMPGGIGAMTIACLLQNTLAAALLQKAES